jgi:hypothetical protein
MLTLDGLGKYIEIWVRLLQNVNVTPAVLAAGNLQVLIVLKLNMAKSHEFNL